MKQIFSRSATPTSIAFHYNIYTDATLVFLAHFMLVERLRFEIFLPLMCATHQHIAQHDLET